MDNPFWRSMERAAYSECRRVADGIREVCWLSKTYSEWSIKLHSHLAVKNSYAHKKGTDKRKQ